MIENSVAFCGLFCEACGVYIATRSDEKELEQIAIRMKTTKEEMRCNGCRSSVLSPHCRECEFRNCAKSKNLENCEDCDSFPCPSLISFQKKMPHRAELFKSAEFRKKHGINSWIIKMKDDYSCPKCKTINSPYYVKCKKCGETPGNSFIARNLELFASQNKP